MAFCYRCRNESLGQVPRSCSPSHRVAIDCNDKGGSNSGPTFAFLQVIIATDDIGLCRKVPYETSKTQAIKHHPLASSGLFLLRAAVASAELKTKISSEVLKRSPFPSKSHIVATSISPHHGVNPRASLTVWTCISRL